MPIPNKLSPEAHAEIDNQARLIAELGDAWQPTAENLRDVIEKVLDAERKAFRELQKASIASAQKRGVKVGRPKKEPPQNFAEVYELYSKGLISQNQAVAILDASKRTFLRWEKEREQKNGCERDASRPRESLPEDELLMLRYLEESRPGPRSAAIVSLSDMAEFFGCSVGKVKMIRHRLVEKGLLEVDPRFLPDGGQAANAHASPAPVGAAWNRFPRSRVERHCLRRMERSSLLKAAPSSTLAPRIELADIWESDSKQLG